MRRLVLILPIVALMAFATAGVASAKAGGTDRPFTGTSSGTTAVTPTGPGTFSSSSSGTAI